MPHHSLSVIGMLRVLLIVLLLTQVGPIPPTSGKNSDHTARAAQEPPAHPTRPVVARVYFEDQAALNLLAASLDIWEVHHAEHYFLALLTPQEWEALARAGIHLEVDAERTHLLETPLSAMPEQAAGIPGFPCYRTVEETYASMAALATNHPALAELIDIGDSWEKTKAGGKPGYDLYVLRLTNEARPGPKPAFFLMAEIHAREYTTAELAIRFGEWLIQNYSLDPDATWLLDHFEVHILPMTNPDGRKFAEEGIYWRKNTDNDDGCTSARSWGVDLNRNHSFKWGGAGTWACEETYQGPNPASEPETHAIQSYVGGLFPDRRGPLDGDPAPTDTSGVFITLHSYSRLVLYPWGWTTASPPNLAGLRRLGRKFGFFNGYEVCQSGEPGCIYATTGTSDDWAYGELGVPAYTFELGTRFFDTCSYFQNTLLPGNMPALLYAFKAVRRPYLDPAGPETLNLAASPFTISAGQAFSLTATADDGRFDSHGWGQEPVQPIAAARYSIDAPSWISGTLLQPVGPADGIFNAPVEGLMASVQPICLPAGKHTLFVESQDSAGSWGVPGAVFFEIAPGAGVGIDPTVGGKGGQAGQTITYTLQVTNLGSNADTFNITVNSQWLSAAPASIGPLAPCASAPLLVTMSIPILTQAGENDIASLTLTSQTDPAQSVLATLTTFVPAAWLFLPFTSKNLSEN